MCTPGSAPNFDRSDQSALVDWLAREEPDDEEEEDEDEEDEDEDDENEGNSDGYSE